MTIGENITSITVILRAKDNYVICKKNEDFSNKPYKLVRSVSTTQDKILDYEEIPVEEYINRYMAATGKSYTDIVKEQNGLN